ncbi:MHYT domain-containing protein [Dongia mobilis]|uniref:MHYT domain-containing protein n=1 Tax=Dongia sp. TaxID=1977262 RepID=UPI0026EB7C36
MTDMLAVQLPVAIDFLVLPTLLSFLVCVLVVGFAVFAVGTGAPNRLRASLAALFMGGGIVSMHYLGMYALHASTHMTHDPLYVIASIVIGVGASGIALWFGFGLGSQRSILVPAVIMALAISAMHYTAMAGLMLHLHGASVTADMPALSPGLLAIVVSVVAFVVSGLFLLTLVPAENRADVEVAAETPMAPQLSEEPLPIQATDHAQGQPAAQHSSQCSLPVEKDGRRLQLDIARLVAVQAQAHYTSLFDGETIWFCPLPISEVEAVLDPMVFARVHRSHIVNLDRVASVRRAADSDVVAMAAKTPYQAPVSRARRSWLRQQLDARATAA